VSAFLVVLLIRLVGVILTVMLVALALWIVPAKAGDRPFDWAAITHAPGSSPSGPGPERCPAKIFRG
jgi:hypothetical protein